MENNIENTTGVEQTAEKEEGAKTYTQEEVNALLQQEGDRRVSAALKKQADKFAKEKAEAQKLQEMDENQKKEYEYEKRIHELEEKEKEFNLMQNKISASKVMDEHGLPVSFVDYIVAEDADTMMENINNFEREWKAAIADAVSARLSSPTPKGGSGKQTGLTREEFTKLTLAQQAEIYRTNPELYKQMVQS